MNVCVCWLIGGRCYCICVHDDDDDEHSTAQRQHSASGNILAAIRRRQERDAATNTGHVVRLAAESTLSDQSERRPKQQQQQQQQSKHAQEEQCEPTSAHGHDAPLQPRPVSDRQVLRPTVDAATAPAAATGRSCASIDTRDHLVDGRDVAERARSLDPQEGHERLDTNGQGGRGEARSGREARRKRAGEPLRAPAGGRTSLARRRFRQAIGADREAARSCRTRAPRRSHAQAQRRVRPGAAQAVARRRGSQEPTIPRAAHCGPRRVSQGDGGRERARDRGGRRKSSRKFHLKKIIFIIQLNKKHV